MVNIPIRAVSSVNVNPQVKKNSTLLLQYTMLNIFTIAKPREVIEQRVDKHRSNLRPQKRIQTLPTPRGQQRSLTYSTINTVFQLTWGPKSFTCNSQPLTSDPRTSLSLFSSTRAFRSPLTVRRCREGFNCAPKRRRKRKREFQ